MAERMAHRGPDGQGTWDDGVAGLAARRLAVIDLHERSNQPLHLAPWHLVFNGEIYNYRQLRDELRGLGDDFVTDGDGEVLLHAWARWEEDALLRLDGMFAFAVWHDERRELVCACDVFGEKPLFWTTRGDRLVFASDVRALREAEPDLGAARVEAIAPYLGRGLMPPIEQSFFAGIHRLPGAHLLRFRGGRIDVRRYWSPHAVQVPARYDEAVDGLRELLVESIRLRLSADVPVGTSLSGGIDSSVIVSLAGRIAGDHRRHAFTARFPGFERDEWRYADAVASAAGVVEHHAIEPTGADLLAELETFVRFHEEPVVSTSVYAQWGVMRAARKAGVTVLLDGQGGDELFAGYPDSSGWALRAQGPGAVVRGLVSARDRGAVLRAVGSERLPASFVLRYRRRRVTPYAAEDVRDAAARVVPPAMTADGLDAPLARELLRQTFHTSMPALLRYADRNSMAHAREVRLPYLDRRVAEYALSLPPGFVYRRGVTKAVLRDTVAGLAPTTVLVRRDKIAFETPQQRWLSDPAWVARIGEVLLDRRARARGLYATPTIEADLGRGRWRDPDGIWRALNLELWLDAFENRAVDGADSRVARVQP
jgi:asparagine synthase (glutamine-hydrolysing)